MKKILLLTFNNFYAFSYSQTFESNLGSNSLKWFTEQKDFNRPLRVGVYPVSIKFGDNYGGLDAPSTWVSLLEISGKSEHVFLNFILTILGIAQRYFIDVLSMVRMLGKAGDIC